VNATELRKRIDAYFSGEGAEEQWVFSIPKGSYGPIFRRRLNTGEDAGTTDAVPQSIEELPAPFMAPVVTRRVPWIWIALVAILAGVSGLLLWQNLALRHSTSVWDHQPELAAFWTGFVKSAPQTDIVLPDASVTMSEEIVGREMSLDEYLDRNFFRERNGEKMSADRRQALEIIFNHNLVALGDFHAAQQILGLSPVSPLMHLTLARFYEADSIKRHNLILIGGKKANPWLGLFEEQLNFSLNYDPQNNQAQVRNKKPAAGEQAIYAPAMERNALVAYSIVAYLPNPSRSGKVMILEGTDSDATGAAAEFITSEKGLEELKNKLHASTEIPYFEILLKTSRLSGTSFSAEPLAVRSYSR
jgi:hypothetical protein